MSDPSKSKHNGSNHFDSQHWAAIEHSLELAIKAEDLRERSRKLREESRLIREESRVSRKVSLRHTAV